MSKSEILQLGTLLGKLSKYVQERNPNDPTIAKVQNAQYEIGDVVADMMGAPIASEFAFAFEEACPTPRQQV